VDDLGDVEDRKRDRDKTDDEPHRAGGLLPHRSSERE
jgi:hypothetical protein